jgi:hypothetical protein
MKEYCIHSHGTLYASYDCTYRKIRYERTALVSVRVPDCCTVGLLKHILTVCLQNIGLVLPYSASGGFVADKFRTRSTQATICASGFELF